MGACELRDRGAAGLRRHDADRIDVGHILARPAQLFDLQIWLQSDSKVDRNGLAEIKCHDGVTGNNVMPGRNVAVETPAQWLVRDINTVQRYRGAQ
jgi:hypothetical protein